jgi:hypothetical protein
MKLFYHPGYGKTATTTFQNNLFNQHSQIINLGRPWSDKTRKLCRELKGFEHFSFDKSKVKNYLNEFDMTNKSKILVLSDENFDVDRITSYQRAKRIRDIFPNSEVILTIRSQVSMLESLYYNEGRSLKGVPKPYSGRHVSLENWFSFILNDSDSIINHLNYFDTVKMYEEVFCKVHVLLFEDLVDAPDSYTKRLSDILGVDENQSYNLMQNSRKNDTSTNRQYWYGRLRSKLFPSISFSNILPYGDQCRIIISSFILNGPSGRKIKLTEGMIQVVNQTYKEGNHKLNKEYSLKMDKYNYPL